MSVHIVHFFGSLSQSTVEGLRDTCLKAHAQGATEIRIHFSSDGGSTSDSFALYNFLRSLPIPVVMHNLGTVESIAIVVFLAGERRLACPHTRFLIHSLHWNFNAGRVDHARLREHLGSLDNDLERYVQVFSERTAAATQPLNIRSHLLGQEKILAPDEALAAGITYETAEATVPADAVVWWVSGAN